MLHTTAIMIWITTVIQIHIQIQADCHFRYERVYSFLASVHGNMRRETQFLKVFANHTMLTLPQCAAHLAVFKISIAGPDLKNWTSCLNSRKSDSRLQRSNTQLTSFQNPQILLTISSGYDVIHTPASFPAKCLLWQMVIIISFLSERQTASNDSKPYQTEW